MESLLIIIIGMVALIFTMMVFAAKSYIKCPTNKILVIYGRVPDANTADGVKIVRNGGTFVWPVIQDYFFLDLEKHHLELSPTFKTKDGMKVKAEMNFTVGISPDDPYAGTAASRLALKSKQELQDIFIDIIYGATFRELEQIDLVELATTPNSRLLDRLVQATAKELGKLGVLVSTIKLDFVEDAQAILRNIEEKFQQQKVLSDNNLSLVKGSKELEQLNSQLQQNAKEREELLHQKIVLLARMENASGE